MNVSRMGRRLATAGFASALAAGALVGASTTAADAAAGTTPYTCTFPAPVGDAVVPVDISTVDISSAFPTIPAGLPIPAGTLTASYVFHATAAVTGLLSHVTSVGSSDMSMLMHDAAGDNAVPVGAFTLGAPVTAADGTSTIPATASNGDFSIPGASVYTLTMPKSFTLTAVTALGNVPVPCSTAAEPAVLDTLTVVKNDSFTTVKAPATVKKGTAAKVVTTVAGGVTPFSGKVVLSDGTRKLGTATLNDAGKAVYKAKGLALGKHKITAKWAGDAYRNASKSKVVIVKVVK